MEKPPHSRSEQRRLEAQGRVTTQAPAGRPVGLRVDERGVATWRCHHCGGRGGAGIGAWLRCIDCDGTGRLPRETRDP